MSFLNVLMLALKQTLRDARAGDLYTLGLAIVVAIAALSSVGFLVDRVDRGLERDAAQLLGADLLIDSDTPLDPVLVAQASQSGLMTAQTWQFPSMVGSDQSTHLAALKAVSDAYPLRGGLRIVGDEASSSAEVRRGPGRGDVWVDAQVLVANNLHVGDELNVGDIKLKIQSIISYEPDRGAQFMNLAPRVMLNANDLERTGLITYGSRVNYSLLVAGASDKVDAYKAWVIKQLKAGQKLVTVDSGRPEIKRSLERAQQFLRLVAILAGLIASIAIVLGARQFGLRHRRNVAVMRCLGASRAVITTIFVIEFLLVGLSASVVGLLVGALGQSLIVSILGSLIGMSLPMPGLGVVSQSLCLGVCLLLALAWPTLRLLQLTSPNQVLRSAWVSRDKVFYLHYLPAVLGLLFLMSWVARDGVLGVSMVVGFAIATILFSLIGYVALKFLASLRLHFAQSSSLRFGLSGLIRRRHTSVVQICALAMGMMAILLLMVVRTDLLAGWQKTLPVDAPNRFLINIQPDQIDPVRSEFNQAKFESLMLYPMVRGRLIKRNGVPIGSADFDEPRAKQLIDREFNLSYADHLPLESRITEGRGLNPEAFEVSLESGLAKTLRLSLGDELIFDVAGQLVPVKVTSIRKVDWDSMKPNFFAIMTSTALKEQPQTWMTAFYLKAAQAPWLQTLIKKFPNLTVFDLDAILGQIRAVLGQVSLAVQGLFVFSVLAGMMVLGAALSTTRDERVREAALLRALGATRLQLLRAQRVEFIVIGLCAGVLAALGATIIAWCLSIWLFQFRIVFSVWPWIVGVAVCTAGSWFAGAITLKGILHTPPLAVLRRTG